MTRILVVEDEDSFSDALAFLLTKEGFEVEVADNGRNILLSTVIQTVSTYCFR